ncbi:hypothetical protein LX36DRAFT_176158 [Colletotrichum falcatum]|nr:hypothetical protein LX36DRAFT_176158 [Colletotrichum falcatum]
MKCRPATPYTQLPAPPSRTRLCICISDGVEQESFICIALFLSALPFDVVTAASGNGNGTLFEGFATSYSWEFSSLALWRRRINRLGRPLQDR